MIGKVIIYGCQFPAFSKKYINLSMCRQEYNYKYVGEVMGGGDFNCVDFIEEGVGSIHCYYNKTADITIRGGVCNHIYCEFDKRNKMLTAKITYEESPEITREIQRFESGEPAHEEQSTSNKKDSTEHRMKCKVCGQIFCYTDKDLSENTKNASLGALTALGGLSSAFGGGTIFHTQHLKGQSDRYTDKIIDYSRCPFCRSTDIVEIADEETIQQQNSTPVSASSPTDEIKKYKELLDMGIITQEEFNEKKKQLLGL